VAQSLEAAPTPPPKEKADQVALIGQIQVET
jgi:hypothetical protein